MSAFSFLLNRRGYAAGLMAVFFLSLAIEAHGELREVRVGGEIRTRGRWYINTWTDPFPQARRRIPDYRLTKRPVGMSSINPWMARGRSGIKSLFKWDDRGSDWTRFESCVKLNVTAEFSEEVTAFIEFYDWFVWSEDFRSRDYVTGADTRADSSDDLEVEQAYIEIRNLFDIPLRARIGRQELRFGKGWLVTNMLTPSQYVSHDAIRLTWTPGNWTVDAFASKLTENFDPDEDVDFYGVYGDWKVNEGLNLSGYWFLLRDGREPDYTDLPWYGEVCEDLSGVNDFGQTLLHTAGLRAYGRKGGWDYDLEVAYQFGEADAFGALFMPVGRYGLWGDRGAEFDNLAGELTIGYTFSGTPWKPRVYVMGAYYEGEDNRDISFLEWLNPFYRPEASISFNRLFSDKNYMPVANDNGWMSNFYQVQAGFEAQPLEKVRVHLHGAKSWADEPFDFPVMPWFSFWTREGSDDLGWETAAWIKYNYSDSLWFLLYGSYLWTGKGLTDGAFIQSNGNAFSGGSDDDNAGYVFWMAVLRF